MVPCSAVLDVVRPVVAYLARLLASHRSAAACLVGNSFVPGTRVLMADGTSKPIENVKTGDKVLATDPETGEQGPRTVLATIVGTGAKTLVEITVDTTTEKPADDGGDR